MIKEASDSVLLMDSVLYGEAYEINSRLRWIDYNTGREEGLQQGMQNANRNTARNLLLSDVSKDVIARSTGLSLEEIDELAMGL